MILVRGAVRKIGTICALPSSNTTSTRLRNKCSLRASPTISTLLLIQSVRWQSARSGNLSIERRHLHWTQLLSRTVFNSASPLKVRTPNQDPLFQFHAASRDMRLNLEFHSPSYRSSLVFAPNSRQLNPTPPTDVSSGSATEPEALGLDVILTPIQHTSPYPHFF
ncbi:hypothetical protein K443DRAFT_326924 [Laccaria amethystina LaAM-08-1]|uniref:Uncharacterized protein n=1 Tax=Laccaria amethystina LaAM-08-1 TaxID=1095629 RepID=A0A0C9XL74_9AGAR|nr:hypothetical protein K443DRAFT_326924 [Laccaria amethystina LaAM-08-1]